MVYGHLGLPLLGAGGQAQLLIRDGHEGVGRDDVNLVGLHPGAVLHLAHRHFGQLGQELGQEGLVRGVQVLHHHEGHARVGGQHREELGQGLVAAGRGADAHHQGRLRLDLVRLGGFLAGSRGLAGAGRSCPSFAAGGGAFFGDCLGGSGWRLRIQGTGMGHPRQVRPGRISWLWPYRATLQHNRPW